MKTWLVVIFSFLSFCDNEFVFVLSSKNDGCKRTEILDFKAEFEVMKGNSHTLLKRVINDEIETSVLKKQNNELENTMRLWSCKIEELSDIIKQNQLELNETRSELSETKKSFADSLSKIEKSFTDSLALFNQSACKNCECHTGWIHFQNSCYLFANVTLNWYNASSSCQSYHADLVKVETVDEEMFLKTNARALKKDFWLGARDETTEGSWVWSTDDSDLDYNDWFPNEPNNWGGNEDCLALEKHGEHWQWNDGPCGSYSIQYICEKSALGLKPGISG